ncbi:MAG: NAD-dependent epimerase/dehydratase family protein [Polyangiaceae bacterium]
MAKYLVTGATGFLGTHLVLALVEAGHDVTAFAREAHARSFPAGVKVVRGDITDAAAVKAVAKGKDGVFHAAGRVSRSAADAEEMYTVHVRGTKTVLEAARDAGVRRAVFVSSSGTIAVSEDPDRIATEDDERPIGILNRWPYYRAKYFAEQAALAMNGPAFDVVSVNPTLLLGPGDLRGSSTEDVRLFLEKKIPAVPPGGISFVDVRDAAQALLLAMEKGKPGATYLVGAVNLTLREFFAKLERVSGVSAPWLPVPRAPEVAKVGVSLFEKLAKSLGARLPVDAQSLDMAQYYWYLDASRAENELGFVSRDPMETLTDTVADLRDRGVVWPESRDEATPFADLVTEMAAKAKSAADTFRSSDTP